MNRSVNASSRDFQGFPVQMSFAKLLLVASTRRPLPKITSYPLPTRPVAINLIQAAIEKVLFLYPVLAESRIFGALESICSGAFSPPLDHWIVRLVLAIGLMTRSRQDDSDHQQAVSHVAMALQGIELVVNPGSVEGIQAILLLAVYSLLDPRFLDPWYLIGGASRVALVLGLHQDAFNAERLHDPQIDMRRRLYCCTYALDR